MCAILGQVNKFDSEWAEAHVKKALERGTDLITESAHNYRLYHTRLATNPSKDQYPVEIEGRKFAMNGIVAQARYDHLRKKYKDRTGYTVDSAFLLLEWLDTQNWEQFDNSNYVFSFWLLDGGYLYIGNKDYPLYSTFQKEVLWFSSFNDVYLQPNGMSVKRLNLKTNVFEEVYAFKELLYAIN